MGSRSAACAFGLAGCGNASAEYEKAFGESSLAIGGKDDSGERYFTVTEEPVVTAKKGGFPNGPALHCLRETRRGARLPLGGFDEPACQEGLIGPRGVGC